MQQPGNAAAEQIVRAQSIMSDLTIQQGEIQAAITRQQALVDALLPVAEWAPSTPSEPEEPAEEPEVDEQTSEEDPGTEELSEPEPEPELDPSPEEELEEDPNENQDQGE